jgi:hypothetical protein
MYIMTDKKEKLHISPCNDKMGAVPSFSVTAGITCPKDAPCRKFCYAKAMEDFRDTIKKSYRNNMERFQRADKQLLAEKFSAFIKKHQLKFFRWNVSGDFRIDGYFEFACQVAENCPNTKFLAFTKCFELAFCDRPKNFTLILSAWNDYQPTEKQAERCGIAYYCDGSRPMPEHAKVCSGKCDECFRCFNLRPGEAVIFEKH